MGEVQSFDSRRKRVHHLGNLGAEQSPSVLSQGQSTVAIGRFSKTCAATLLSVAVLVMTGCATNPNLAEAGGNADAGAGVKQLESLEDYVSRARAANEVEGGRERVRQIYRDAAAAYPADKRPWMSLAQNYFDAADYGNAILAAQEVVQRDPNDVAARGVLAVSGLRISTEALSVLRNQTSQGSSVRAEAEEMARNLRSILGASVLVPRPAESAKAANAPASKPAPRGVRTTPKPTAPAPGAAPTNPFGALR